MFEEAKAKQDELIGRRREEKIREADRRRHEEEQRHREEERQRLLKVRAV